MGFFWSDESGLGVVHGLGMFENGEGFLAVKRERGFELLPLTVIDLDRELLGSTVVASIRKTVLAAEFADFIAEPSTFGPPRDKNGMGVGLDEAETFGGGFKAVGSEIPRIRWKTSLARDDTAFIPVVCFGSCLPDGVLKITPDQVGVEKIAFSEIWEDLGPGNGGVGRQISEPLWNGVGGGLKIERPAFDSSALFVSKFAVAVASPGGLGEGIQSAFRAIHDGKTDIHTGFDELRGDKHYGVALFP